MVVNNYIYFLLCPNWGTREVKITRWHCKLFCWQGNFWDIASSKLISCFFIINVAVLCKIHIPVSTKAYKCHGCWHCASSQDQGYFTFPTWMIPKRALFHTNNTKIFNIIFGGLEKKFIHLLNWFVFKNNLLPPLKRSGFARDIYPKQEQDRGADCQGWNRH